jgi:Na+-driven multidrug efflux pump
MAVRLISALKRNGVLLIIATVNTVVNAVLNWLLMWRYGVAGIALSTSIVYVVCCVLVFASLYLLIGQKRERPDTEDRREAWRQHTTKQ